VDFLRYESESDSDPPTSSSSEDDAPNLYLFILSNYFLR